MRFRVVRTASVFLAFATSAAAQAPGPVAFENVTVLPMDIDRRLLDADPLVNVGNVRHKAGVMANGQWIPRTELDQRLGELRIR